MKATMTNDITIDEMDRDEDLVLEMANSLAPPDLVINEVSIFNLKKYIVNIL